MLVQIHPALPLPQYATEGSALFDIHMAEDSAVIKPGQIAKLPTGLVWNQNIIASDTSDILMLKIRSRSGLAYNKGLIVVAGEVDIDYPDEICVLLHNTSKETHRIEFGQRIAQGHFLLVHREPLWITDKQRVGGFGSTGV